MKETIFEHLMSEHEEMRQMLDALVEQFDEKTFKELAKELEGHQEAEEEVLYMRLKNEPAVHEHVLHGIEEHSASTEILRKLQSQNPGTETWMAKMWLLREDVNHHLEHEENELFPQAESIVPQDEAMKLTEEFETAKKRVPVHA